MQQPATNVLSDNTKLNLFHDGGNFRIFTSPSHWPYCQPYEWTAHLRETDYIFFLDWNNAVTPEHQMRLANGLGDRAYFLSSSVRSHELRKSLGLRSHLISNNIFINENQFHCTPLNDRKFDAVYTARAAAVKRIGLAARVDRLALVVNRNFVSSVISLDESYKDVPYDFLNPGPMTAGELCELYNNSRCGLILSVTEGASFTVIEYLLSGIPVVSTKPETATGLGGREVWLNSFNCKFVDPTLDAVRDGVAELVSLERDPLAIRMNCINNLYDQRKYLCRELLEPIFERHNSEVSAEEAFFGYDAWLKTGAKRHRFSAEHANRTMERTLALFEN